MNPLPAKILVPTTANRIPWNENAQAVIDRLFGFQINASAFLMDGEHLEELETKGFMNDFERAFEDFFYQIPEELRRKVFPVKLDDETTSDASPLPGGRTYIPRVAV